MSAVAKAPIEAPDQPPALFLLGIASPRLGRAPSSESVSVAHY